MWKCDGMAREMWRQSPAALPFTGAGGSAWSAGCGAVEPLSDLRSDLANRLCDATVNQ